MKKLIKSKTKNGKIQRIYYSQRCTSKRRGHTLPDYTLRELTIWCLEQPLYHELYEMWEVAEYNKWLAPSCDRINDCKPYTLDNLQLMTWEENDEKGRKIMRKCVCQYTKTGVFVKEYISIREAARQIGGQQTHIVQCCKGRRKSASGYKWIYKIQ